MSQLTIYLDDESMRAVKSAARRERLSVSKWASQHLGAAARRTWPKDYFALFGSLADCGFERAAQGEPGLDTPREAL
jgi:hypothetical protein